MTEIKRRNDRFIRFYFFLMYLFTSMPALQFNMMANSNTLFLVFGYGITIIAAYKYKVNVFNKKFLLFVLVVTLWTIAQFIFHRAFFRLSPFIILEFFSALVIIRIYGYSIIRRYENVTYVLCIIALIGWSLCIIFQPIMEVAVKALGIEADGDHSSSFILYTVNLNDSIRNCGFSWEPGRMACMICIGILFYIMRTRYNLRTKRFWIMVLCLITTLSTTGFCTLLVILMLCYIAIKRVNPIVLASLILLSISVLSLPFMYEKIVELAGHATEEGVANISNKLDWEVSNKGDAEREFYVPQRFQGLMLSAINVMNSNHIIGDGRDFTEFYVNRVLDWKVKTSEGILEPIVQYGVIIALIMYLLLLRTSKNISCIYKIPNKWLYFFIFIMINISYNFWETPLFMSIWIMPIFIKFSNSHKFLSPEINSNAIPIACMKIK